MTPVANRTEAVDRFLATLDHPLKVEIVALRTAILASNDRITERIKWNAPSFGYDDDRVTFKLHPADRLQLIFHRGARVKDTTGFTFEDPSGLLRWATPDRAVVTLRDAGDIETHQAALLTVITAWIDATST
ncbi:MAG TPA: DUF1801 domain-containing protein [Thermomicrobiales bacterium]|nr:DUF1801 domain-containing protein [Thermomicrobiales bacterium]